MRIAFSGTHRAGKTTLLERVAELLPGYTTIAEPYHLLEEDGHESSEVPSLEDFVEQLERSIASIEESDEDTLFDRSPADVLAYLTTHEDADEFDAEEWLDRVRDAMQSLDLVVFVPIEAPDRIALPAHEDREMRAAVHEKLVEILVDDAFAFDVEVVKATGDVAARAKRVMARVNGRGR